MAGTDGVDLDTAGAEQAMNRVDNAGGALTTGWSAAHSSITAAEGQLGRGPLGEAFMAGYRPQATPLAEQAQSCTPLLGRFATAGRAGCRDYQQADASAAAAMPGGAGASAR